MASQKDQLQRFQRLFKGRETVYGQWKKGGVTTVKEQAPEEVWVRHLQGQGPFLGMVPVTLDNQCYFGAIDLDDDDTNHAALAATVELAELPLVVCRSKSGGAHLYLFMKEPIPAKLMQTKLKQWAAALQISKNHDDRPVEVFPKNAKLNPSETGNWINLPYYGGAKTDRPAITADGNRLNLLEFLSYAEERMISQAELEGLTGKGTSRFEGGPPCLNTLDRLGYPEGSRNMGLYNLAIYLKLRHPEDWEQRLADYNQEKMEPPVKDDELRAITKSIGQRDYVYKCEELPIQPHCEKVACKKEKWGISAFKRKARDNNLPSLSNLRKVMTDPPRWLLDVEGVDIELITEDLMMMPRFRRAVLEKCSRIYPLMKQQEWDDVLMELLVTQTVIEAPADAGAIGQFKNLLNEFLLRRKNSETKEDLLAGLPWQDGPRIYFRSNDLLDFLTRKKFNDYSPGKVFTVLRSMGAGHDKFNIKGAGVQVWYLAEPDEEQNGDFTARTVNTPDF